MKNFNSIHFIQPQLRCISSLLDMKNNQTITKMKQIVPQVNRKKNEW